MRVIKAKRAPSAAAMSRGGDETLQALLTIGSADEEEVVEVGAVEQLLVAAGEQKTSSAAAEETKVSSSSYEYRIANDGRVVRTASSPTTRQRQHPPSDITFMSVGSSSSTAASSGERDAPPSSAGSSLASTSPQQRAVRFAGLDGAVALLEERWADDDDEAEMDVDGGDDKDVSVPSLKKKLAKTQKKLSAALVDLSAEKTLRRRKEKNLLKLAKELTSRAAELKDKDGQIDLLLKSNGKGDDASKIYKQQEAVIAGLRRQIVQANSDTDRLRAKLARERKKKNRATLDRIRRFGNIVPDAEGRKRLVLPAAIAVVVVGLLFAAAAVAPYNDAAAKMKRTVKENVSSVRNAALDVLCAPAMPGSSFPAEEAGKKSGGSSSRTFEAPWWIPSSVSGPSAKTAAFRLVCGADRLRTSLVWGSGKLSAYRLVTVENGNGDQQQPIWTNRRAKSVEVSKWGDAIILRDKRGDVSDEIAAPWIL